jgi:hypothetical protein
MDALSLFAQATSYTTTSSSSDGGSSIVVPVITLIICVIALIGTWRTYTKAGQPGWAAIIPIYNIYILTKMARRPGWWTVLYLIPVVNLVISLFIAIDIGKAFGKSEVFSVALLWLLSPIGNMILGFGSATYNGNALGGPAGPTTPVIPSGPTPSI